MAAPHTAPPTTKPAPLTHAQLRANILNRLALALDAAAARLQSAAAGRSTFASDADLKAALALLRLAPALLPLLQPGSPPPPAKPPPPPPELPYWKQPGFQIPLIPKCCFCGMGPGAHWDHDCPKNPDINLPDADRINIMARKRGNQ
jgi:hypothetical protein